MARFARALSIAMFVAAAMPVCSASAAVDEVAQGREIAQRLCAGCHMRPGQGEKSDHSQIPSFRAVANRPGQSLENGELAEDRASDDAEPSPLERGTGSSRRLHHVVARR